jgi:L,D-peptidoglycan transpeptidase YkuD (ErfK/YbiS/YcfS/YnhG family)
MNLILQNNQLFWGDKIFPCSLGYGGIKREKQEGDRATPEGFFPFRRVFFRADRLEKPETLLHLQALSPQDGWCDDIHDESYNQHVRLPYKGGHEILWREDHVYDLILVVGHNDDPIEKGKGSAVFVHLHHPEKTPTEGCVALELQHLLQIIQEGTQESSLVVIA